MLRVIVLLLLLANGAFFVWSQGMLSGWGLAPTSQSEPERVKDQIAPEALRLQTSEPGALASAEAGPSNAAERAVATTASASCWQVAGLATAQLPKLRATLSELGLAPPQWKLVEVRSPGRWLIYMGRQSEQQLERKKLELKAMEIEYSDVTLPISGPGLSLGAFSSEEAAQQAFNALNKKGVRTARVALERPPATTTTLHLPAITAEQQRGIEALGDALEGKKLQKCG